jgi:glycosyltransferase involved in cell wall biosynthesis
MTVAAYGNVRTVHLVEPGGRGGVFQHTAALAEALAVAGMDVCLHTADDAELKPSGVAVCGCVHWPRRFPTGLRQTATAAGYITRTVPHLVRQAGRTDIVHVQGLFHPTLMAALIAVLRTCGKRVAFSPHNTFARSGRRLDAALIQWAARNSHVVFAFSEADRRELHSWGIDAVGVELVQMVPSPAPERVAAWRARYGRTPVALLAGQVRPDKRPEVFVSACALAGVRAAIVGEDKGGERLAAQEARRRAVDVVRGAGYLDLESFTAAIAAADVVVFPYAVASMSGPLSVANALGVRTVATDVGGLREHATVTAEASDPEAIARAIAYALAGPKPKPAPPGVRCAGEHIAGYERARRHR